MKKYRYITFLLGIILFVSCNPVEENLFDDSSAIRIEKSLLNTQDVLKNAENGWLMEYYPSSQQTYGGYNILAKFSESEVTIASEIADFDTTEKSLYSLKQSAGPVLTLDTYNEIFHVFSDPNSSKSGLGSNGKGMEGDFEFLILKSTQDSVILKGKKTGNRIIMTPIQSGTDWGAYVEELQEASEIMAFKNFEYHVAGQIIPVRVSYRSLIMTYTNEEGNEVTLTAPYIQTLTGYKLYKPLTVLGVEVEEFIYGKEGDMEYFTPNGGVTAKLVAVFPPLNQVLVSGNWYFKFSALGALGKTYWNNAKVNGLDVIGEELYYAYMGLGSDGKYGFNFASYDGVGLYGGALHFTYQLNGDESVSYKFALAGSGDGVWYYNNARFNNMIYPLHGGATKTFTLTADNLKDPTWIKLTDVDNADNTITLESIRILWPFDN